MIRDLKQKLLLTAALACAVLLMRAFSLPCPYLHLFGIQCPGCGMTRAVLAALRLDFSAAFHHHWMFWAPPVVWVLFLFDWRLFRVRWLDRGLLVLIVAGFLANWLWNGPIFVGRC